VRTHHVVAGVVALVATLLPAFMLECLGAQASVPDRPRTTSQGDLRKAAAAARIQLADAVKRALERVPGVALRASFEMVRIDAQLVPRYEVEILEDDAFWDVQVDAVTGEVTHLEEHGVRSSDRLFQMMFDFEKEELPAGFQPQENAGAGTPASWSTQRVEDAPDGRRVAVVESRSGKFTYNLLFRRGPSPVDLTVSTMIQAWKGHEDQGGGLLWRAKDHENYYVARWNPLERNLRLYTVVDGKRSMPMKSVEIDADPKAWHELKVTMIGPRVVIRFDGRVVIEAEDSTFADGKGAGLWTKADASTRFDSLRISPAK
jgi:hypothetical protein